MTQEIPDKSVSIRCGGPVHTFRLSPFLHASLIRSREAGEEAIPDHLNIGCGISGHLSRAF